MSKHDARAVETQKKKARRAIPRAAISRTQGNTAAARKRAKKNSGLARAAAAKAAASAAHA